MKFYYKERTAKNQCKVLSEDKGMITIQMRNGGKFLVSKKSVLNEITEASEKSFDILSDVIAKLSDLRRQIRDEEGAGSKLVTDKIQKAINILHESFAALKNDYEND